MSAELRTWAPDELVVAHVLSKLSDRFPGRIQRPELFAQCVRVTVDGKFKFAHARASIEVHDGFVRIPVPVDVMEQKVIVDARTLPELIRHTHHMITNMMEITDTMELRAGRTEATFPEHTGRFT